MLNDQDGAAETRRRNREPLPALAGEDQPANQSARQQADRTEGGGQKPGDKKGRKPRPFVCSVHVGSSVIIPFLIGRISGLHAASFSFMPWVMPPIPLVRAAHWIDGTAIVFRFRVTERQIKGLPVAFKAWLDQLASERVLSLACFLDT